MSSDDQKLLWIQHLRTLADEHKKNCNENCYISLTTIKDMAEHFRMMLHGYDAMNKAAEIMKGWPY